MTPNTATDETEDEQSEERARTAGLVVGGHRVTDTMVGSKHENCDTVRRGAYPDGLDPTDFVGTLRRFTGKLVQYLEVVGDMDGHAVYRMMNEDGPDHRLHSMPWDEFIDETAHVQPGAPGAVRDDPARTVVRADFDTIRARRRTEVETGCTCLDGEECDRCPPDEGEE